MQTSEQVINYLIESYRPSAIILYGSFADGSANQNSDFDALVIANHEKMHDSSVVDGITLDVFVYPPDTFQSEYNPEEFVQVWDGKIIMDKNGIADHRVIVIQILASCSELPVRELNLYGSSVRDSEKRVITAVDKPDTVFFLVHHLLPPFASGNSREN